MQLRLTSSRNFLSLMVRALLSSPSLASCSLRLVIHLVTRELPSLAGDSGTKNLFSARRAASLGEGKKWVIEFWMQMDCGRSVCRGPDWIQRLTERAATVVLTLAPSSVLRQHWRSLLCYSTCTSHGADAIWESLLEVP